MGEAAAKLKKPYVLSFIFLGVLLGTLFVIRIERQSPSPTAQAAILQIDPYPTLAWSAPKQATFQISLSNNVESPSLADVDGEEATAETSQDIGKAVFSFYNQRLTEKGFSLLKATNKAGIDKYWVVGWRRDNDYFELQYYPTPYSSASNTVLVFFGSLQNN